MALVLALFLCLAARVAHASVAGGGLADGVGAVPVLLGPAPSARRRTAANGIDGLDGWALGGTMDPERAALLATVECDAHESFEFIHANMTCARSVPYWLDTYYWAYVLILSIGIVPVSHIQILLMPMVCQCM